MLSLRERHYPRGSLGPEEAVALLNGLAHLLLDDVAPSASWVGTGIGIPTFTDIHTGGVTSGPSIGCADMPFGTLLMRAFGAEYGDAPYVVIGNDAELAAIAEHRRGAATGTRKAVYLAGRTGIGGGIVIDGRPMTGTAWFGGEFGHILVNLSGEICRCGSRGCWETLIGCDAILRDAQRSLETDLEQIVVAAQAGDSRCRASLDKFGLWLGIGLRNVVGVVNPEVVVLGGHLGMLLPEVRAIVDAQLRALMPSSREQTRIVAASLGHDSTLVGAAEAAFAPLLTDPLQTLASASTPARQGRRCLVGLLGTWAEDE